MTEALRCAEEHDLLLSKIMDMDVNGEDALKVAKQELEEKETGLHEVGDYKTVKNKGEKQPEFLKALDFVDKWSDNTQLFN
eukprot:1063043-Pyramimonas_sp.AAC.1